jgi:glucan biosynthesis protein C
MWFVVALLASSLEYAALRSIRPLTGLSGGRVGIARRRSVDHRRRIAGSVAGHHPVGHPPSRRARERLDAGLSPVRLAVMAAAAGWSGRLSRDTERWLGQVATVGGGLTVVLVSFAETRDQLDAGVGRVQRASASFATLYGVVSVTFPLWCLTWVRRRWPTRGPLMVKAGRGSRATYVLHPVVLLLVTLAFRVVPLGPELKLLLVELKFLLVAVVAVPVCLARLPGVGRVP